MPRSPLHALLPCLILSAALVCPLQAAPAVIDHAHLAAFDGTPAAAVATASRFRRVFDELHRVADDPAGWPDARATRFGPRTAPGTIALGLVDLPYGAEGDPRAPRITAARPGEPVRRAFAFAPLAPRTYRGAALTLVLDPAYVRADWPAAPELALDADDGRGFRPIVPGAAFEVRYASTGTQTLRLRATHSDGGVRYAFATLEVAGLETPDPHDTLAVAGAPYLGGSATGSGFVYLAPGHTTIENPVVVVEGLDLDNSLGWDELYALLSGENLIEGLRADGYDLVVLDFTDATDYVQRNAAVLVDLLGQVRTAKPPTATVALVGASMGGVVARHALASMEAQAVPHDVRTFISFDAPHLGGNIPLGIQYWFEFFADQAAEVQALRDVLNRPAPRQLLVYHFTVPPGATGQPDPLRGTMQSELGALGWPALPRKVAVANGSGTGTGWGFAPADSIVLWNYNIGIAVIRGNVRAVPNGTSAQIFDGRLFVLFSVNRTQSVVVSGTLPYDNAPGGGRNSMQQMDETPAPYGDIIAVHPSHSFIPTVSAIALAGADLFHDVAGDPTLPAGTPFDALYVPALNQPHIEITAENAAWFRSEIAMGLTALGPLETGATTRFTAGPNPFTSRARLRFDLPRAADVRLAIYGVDGRRIATLADRAFAAGTHAIEWDGRDAHGRPVAPGVWFAALESGGAVKSARLVRLE